MRSSVISGTPPGTSCPYCHARIASWPERIPVHGCQTCLRPLLIHRATWRSSHLYRITPLFHIAKQITAIAALAILAAIAFDLVTIRTVFSAIIITFFINGSMDAADGYLGIKTRIDRSWNKLTSADRVIAQAGLKVFVGAVLLLAAMFGLATLIYT